MFVIKKPSKEIKYDYLSGETLGGQRVVMNNNGIVYYADNTNLEHINKVTGITQYAVTSNALVTVICYGEFEEVGWNWDISKPLWLSTSGAMTQTCPETGFRLLMGRVITPTKIFINPGIYIK